MKKVTFIDLSLFRQKSTASYRKGSSTRVTATFALLRDEPTNRTLRVNIRGRGWHSCEAAAPLVSSVI